MGFTVEDVVSLCKKYKVTQEDKTRKYLGAMIDIVKPDEELLFAATSGFSFVGNSKSQLWNATVVVTNKRLLYAGGTGTFKKVPVAGAIPINNVSSANPHKGETLGTGAVVIETIGHDDFKLSCLDPALLNMITSDLIEAIDTCKAQSSTLNSTVQQVVQQVSSADEIRKYKALLDDGIISPEEFELKKKSLLGL